MNDIAATTGSPGEAELPTARRRSWLGKAVHALTLLLPGIVILIFWQWAAGRLIKEIYVSKPTAVAERLYELFSSGEIYPHLWTTGQELVLGYVIGVTGGILAGYALGRSPRLASIFEPYVMAFYGIPKIALAPLFILWFGVGLTSKVVLATFVVFFLVFYNTYAGVLAVEQELVDVLRLMGGSRWQIVRKVILPSALIWIFTGMKSSVPYALIGAVVGEMMASNKGLGYLIQAAAGQYDTGGVFAALFVLMIIATGLHELLKQSERLMLRWREEGQNED